MCEDKRVNKHIACLVVVFNCSNGSVYVSIGPFFFTLIWARIAAVIANKVSSKGVSRVAGVVMVSSSVIF